MTDAPEIRLHRAVFGASFAISALLAFALAFESDVWAVALVFFAGSIVAAPGLMRALARRGHSLDWWLAVAALNLLLVVPEMSLRLAGFGYESGIQFGYPRPSKMLAFEPDAVLFWRLPASDPEVNSDGFLGPEIVRPKPPGTFRILFLGDSCTYQRYPRLVKTLLSRRPDPQLEVDAVNLGVPGYSSYQGRRLAEITADEFEADLVFVHFGWNDHWLAYGEVDAEKRVEVPTGLRATALYREFASLRLLQFGRKLRHGLRSAPAEAPVDRVRVPPAEYMANLREIRRIFAARGVPVIFITAPTSHHVLGVPSYLIETNFARDLGAVVKLHAEYVRMTRQVSQEGKRGGLVDLVAAFDTAGEPEKYFTADGIHFTHAGLELIANRVAEITRPFLAAAEARRKAPPPH